MELPLKKHNHKSIFKTFNRKTYLKAHATFTPLEIKDNSISTIFVTLSPVYQSQPVNILDIMEEDRGLPYLAHHLALLQLRNQDL